MCVCMNNAKTLGAHTSRSSTRIVSGTCVPITHPHNRRETLYPWFSLFFAA